MSELAPEATGGQDALPGLEGGDSGPQINPMWNDLLGTLPQGLHGMVIPHLQKWEQGVTQQFQKVHSDYEPFKKFREAQIDPGILDQSYQVYQALERDPQKFIEAVMEHYGLEFEQGLDDDDEYEEDEYEGEEVPFDLTRDPNFGRIQQMTELMAQALLDQQNQKVQAEIEQQLDSDLKAIKEKLPYIPEQHILHYLFSASQANEGPVNVDEVVNAFSELQNQIIAQHRNPSAGAPVVLGAGGGTPSSAVSVGNLSSKDRRNLIVQQLAAAAQQGG